MKTFAIMCFVAAVMAAPVQQAADAQCGQAQAQLEKGIQANLDIQARELKGYACPISSHGNKFL
jgi:hypothetical protein